MGLRVVLETEDGIALESIEDPTNVLHRLLPDAGDPLYACLSVIDWYGDTTFNRLQVPRLLAEWNTLDPGDDAEARRVIDGVRRLAEIPPEDVHLYLKFYGD